MNLDDKMIPVGIPHVNTKIYTEEEMQRAVEKGDVLRSLDDPWSITITNKDGVEKHTSEIRFTCKPPMISSDMNYILLHVVAMNYVLAYGAELDASALMQIATDTTMQLFGMMQALRKAEEKAVDQTLNQIEKGGQDVK